MERQELIPLIGLIIFLLLFFGLITYWIFTQETKASELRNNCESMGYEYYKIVGDYYNCCKKEIQIKDGKYYQEEETCKTGGML